jgi:hypothetical protein
MVANAVSASGMLDRTGNFIFTISEGIVRLSDRKVSE